MKPLNARPSRSESEAARWRRLLQSFPKRSQTRNSWRGLMIRKITWDRRRCLRRGFRTPLALGNEAENNMPFLTANKVRHFYRLEGIAGRPVLVLSHSISTDHSLWDLQ